MFSFLTTHILNTNECKTAKHDIILIPFKPVPWGLNVTYLMEIKLYLILHGYIGSSWRNKSNIKFAYLENIVSYSLISDETSHIYDLIENYNNKMLWYVWLRWRFLSQFCVDYWPGHIKIKSCQEFFAHYFRIPLYSFWLVQLVPSFVP